MKKLLLCAAFALTMGMGQQSKALFVGALAQDVFAAGVGFGFVVMGFTMNDHYFSAIGVVLEEKQGLKLNLASELEQLSQTDKDRAHNLFVEIAKYTQKFGADTKDLNSYWSAFTAEQFAELQTLVQNGQWEAAVSFVQESRRPIFAKNGLKMQSISPDLAEFLLETLVKNSVLQQ